MPKLTVVIGGSYGAGNYGMCGRAFGPRFLFMWPNARISVMGARQAAETLLTVRLDALRARGEDMDEAARAAFVQPILERYEQESERELLDRPAVGRRRDRPARHPPRARARPGRRRPRPDPRAALRRLPHVSGVLVERDGGVARVWLDRPDRRNAFDAGLIAGAARDVRGAGPADASLRAVVLAGRGAASAPAPISSGCARRGELPQAENVAEAERTGGHARGASTAAPCPSSRASTAPRSAAAPASRAAATSCSRAQDARFGFTEVRLGLIPAMIAPFALARIGRSQARALFLTGELFDAASTPSRIGLVTRGARRRRGARRAPSRACSPRCCARGPEAVRAAKALIADLRDGDPAPQAAARGRGDRRAARVGGGPRGHRGASSSAGSRRW